MQPCLVLSPLNRPNFNALDIPLSSSTALKAVYYSVNNNCTKLEIVRKKPLFSVSPADNVFGHAY